MATVTLTGTTNANSINSANATYATARTGGTLSLLTPADPRVGQRWTGTVYQCYEILIEFDSTGIIAAGDTITAATLRMNLYQNDSTTDFVTRARLHDFGAAITTADWVSGAALSGTLLATIDSSTIGATGSYKSFTDVAMAANVTKNGTTRIVLHSDRHEAGTTPTGSEYLTFWIDSGLEALLDLTYTPASVTATAGHASATAWASAGEGSDLDVAPATVTATGAAYQPGISATVNVPAAATASAAAHGTTLLVNAGHASATGAAHGVTAAVRPGPGAATATGAANQPAVAVAINAGLASSGASATAHQPTIDTATYSTAEHVTATGAASDAVPAIAVNAGVATATAAAFDGSTFGQGTTVATVSPPVVLTADALAASIAVAFNAEVASALGEVPQASVFVTVNAGHASAVAASGDALSPLSFTGTGPGPRGWGRTHHPRGKTGPQRPRGSASSHR